MSTRILSCSLFSLLVLLSVAVIGTLAGDEVPEFNLVDDIEMEDDIDVTDERRGPHDELGNRSGASAAQRDEQGHRAGDSAPQRVAKARRFLTFGGNGMLGSATVERLVRLGDDVTIVSRGNWYWDSFKRIRPYVRVLNCDRKKNITSCSELIEVIQQLGDEKLTAVIDFSAYSPDYTRDAIGLLAGKTDVYIHISTDSVYDVSDMSACQQTESRPVGCREEDAVRPTDPYLRDLLSKHHEYANNKLEAEDELVKHGKVGGDQSLPYIILRLPDVLGPRDTTFRFWIYQLWVRLSVLITDRPVTIPRFLVDYDNSFVYADDVAKLIVDVLLTSSEEVRYQAYNLAWSQNITLEKLLKDIASSLNLDDSFEVMVDEDSSSTYLYPTVRRGPIDPSKAVRMLGWRPTPWTDAISETVAFYENAVIDERYKTQLDEIVQIVSGQIYSHNTGAFYDVMEKTYGINLTRFRPHDEL